MSNTKKSSVIAGLLASAALIHPMSAVAQTQSAGDSGSSDAGGLAEIIVTAQKRAENIQDVPIAITALGGEELAERQVIDAASLASVVPNVSFNNAVGETRIGIRGITFDNLYGTGAEARVPFHLDDVYLTQTGNINGTFYDIERIEVLRGPQGTLFGRNAIAGAVNLITRDPTPEFGGYINIDAGNYDAVKAEAAINGPINDAVSFRIAGQSMEHSGYNHNLTTGNDVEDLKMRSVRGKIKIDSGGPVSAVLSADYSLNDSTAGSYFGGFLYPGTALPGNTYPDPNNLRDITADDPKTHTEYYGFGAKAHWDLAPDLTLTSVSGYRHSRQYYYGDSDYGSAKYILGWVGDRSRAFSEELRLEKSFEKGRILIGGYAFDQKYTTGVFAPLNFALFGGPDFLADGIRYGGILKTRSLAAFAEASYDLTPRLHLTAGARYTHDRKSRPLAFFQNSFAPYIPALNTCNQPCDFDLIPASAFQAPNVNKQGDFSPKATIRYDLNSDMNVYASYSEGFKSGGFQPGIDLFGNGFDAETLTDYEAGFKGDFLDKTLRINAAGFYYDYKNLQVMKALAGIGAVLQNAASAELYGVEAEIKWLPVERLQIDFSGALMKSKFSEFTTLDPARPNGPNGDPTEPFDLSGNRLPSAPKYTLNYGIQYSIPSAYGEFTPRLEGYTLSHVYYDQFNVASVAAPSYTIASAFLNWRSNTGKYYGGAYIRNISNEFSIAGAAVGNGLTGFPIGTSFIAPRTYGVRLGVNF